MKKQVPPLRGEETVLPRYKDTGAPSDVKIQVPPRCEDMGAPQM